jgi:hypothetical protein
MREEQVRECIISMDSEKLGAQTIHSLKDIVASPDEMSNIVNFVESGNDKSLLEFADRFNYCVS